MTIMKSSVVISTGLIKQQIYAKLYQYHSKSQLKIYNHVHNQIMMYHPVSMVVTQFLLEAGKKTLQLFRAE